MTIKPIARSIAIITALVMLMTMIPVTSFGAIAPNRVTLTSLSKVTTTSAKVKWKTVSKAYGYQITMATNEKFTINLKTAIVKTGKYTKASIRTYTRKSLTMGKTYYYKVRAYRYYKGKIRYGAYSNVKSIEITPKLTLTMPTSLGSGGTFTYTIKNTAGNKRLFLNLNGENDLSIYGQDVTAIIIPNKETAFDTYPNIMDGIETFAINSIRLHSTGITTSYFTGTNKYQFAIDPGETATVTLRYIYGSKMPQGYNPETDMFSTFFTYGDYQYAIIAGCGETIVTRSN